MSHIESNVSEHIRSPQLTLGMSVCYFRSFYFLKNETHGKFRLKPSPILNRWIEFRVYRLWKSCWFWCFILIFQSGDFIYEIHNEGERNRTKKKSWKKPSSKKIQPNPIQTNRYSVSWRTWYFRMTTKFIQESIACRNEPKERITPIFSFVERKMAKLRKEIGK